MEGEGVEIWFRLSPVGNLYGLSCDESGLFLGGVPLLERNPRRDGEKLLAPRPVDDLSREFEILYGMPVDMAVRSGGLSTVAAALNRGSLALARIASVQIRLPDLPRFSASNDDIVKLSLLLRRGGLLKEE